MAQYRKKPVVIEAELISVIIQAAAKQWDTLPEWVQAAYEEGNIIFCPEEIHIHTIEGTMTGKPTDYLIRGVAGELYPCKAEIFRATYDAV